MYSYKLNSFVESIFNALRQEVNRSFTFQRNENCMTTVQLFEEEGGYHTTTMSESNVL